MPLRLLRLKGQRLDRVHPEPLLETRAGLLVWCRDGVVQLAGLPPEGSDWVRVRNAADRVLFGYLLPFTGVVPLDGSHASLRLLHSGQALMAVTAEVRRRREASTLDALREAVADPVARSRFLRPY